MDASEFSEGDVVASRFTSVSAIGLTCSARLNRAYSA